MYKTGLISGCIAAALGVILGAFGAHGLKAVVTPDQLVIFETGVRYQMYHGFALIFAGILFGHFPYRHVKIACYCFLAGILLFSGSLYAMTYLKISGQVGLGGLGIITPFGGVFFILGWMLLVAGIFLKKHT